MVIMRNPFRKQDENVRPSINGSTVRSGVTDTPAISIHVAQRPPIEYKLSEINDSGVFVPPSPTEERKSFWTSSSRSTSSSHHRSLFNENEPFNISRESFDSYRRSFDISARSPVLGPELKPRISLDSRTFQPPPRTSNSFQRPLCVPGTQEEEEPDTNLEDVPLEDPKPQTQKKRGMFSRFMDSSDTTSERPTSQDGSKWHHLTGRKRAQSGQGAELGSVTKREETPKPDSQLKRELPQPQPQSRQHAQQATPGAEIPQTPEVKPNSRMVPG